MRTIKFRAKRVDNKEWVYGDLIHGQSSKSGRMYILPQTALYPKGCSELDGWEVTPETVGQFTGLLDKNGKEIYDWDIICERLPNNPDASWIVRYDVDMSEYRATNPKDECDDFELNAVYLNCTEVIGNIHDNPELRTNSK